MEKVSTLVGYLGVNLNNFRFPSVVRTFLFAGKPALCLAELFLHLAEILRIVDIGFIREYCKVSEYKRFFLPVRR